jgi:hypothetical protein
MPVTKENLDDVFTYHAPKDDQPTRYANIRTACKAAAAAILDNTEKGADQQAAIRHIREAMMTANASIATNNAV